MRHVKLMSAVFAFPLMFSILWQGESCRKDSLTNVTTGESKIVPTGTWGGDGIRMDVTKRGAKIEFDCAYGAIDEPLMTGSDGRFRFKGVLVMERGGPVREGQEAKSLPASYTGSLSGQQMTLTVTITDTGQTIGTFTLTRGKAARLTKCQLRS
jgi:hypothetical protein